MRTPTAEPQPRWFDVTVIVTLLVAAYLLAGAGGYHRYSYYSMLRDVVFVAWALAAYRFFSHRWFPVTVLGALIVLLFNPISPVPMRKWEWQPYDHATMLLSIAAAIALAWLAFSRGRLKITK